MIQIYDISQVQEGDYVFIQFGHNDQKIKSSEKYSDPKVRFRENLRGYIREIHTKGGEIPVLFTSIVRCHFSGDTLLDTHGDWIVATGAVAEEEKVPALAKYIRHYDFVVAQDGSGNFFTVQEAIHAIPLFRKNETKICIRKGVYTEKLMLPADKDKVTFIGEDENETILSCGDYAQKKNILEKKWERPVGITGINEKLKKQLNMLRLKAVE